MTTVPGLLSRLLPAAVLAAASTVPLAAQPAARTITAREVIERIQKNCNCNWQAKTVDVFKTGSPDTPVTGVATTFMATLDVLERAAASGKNLIITHEPTFYNHEDQTGALAGHAVFAAKQAFIEKHKLVVWRFHDHWHAHRPDGINTGMIEKFGWKDYAVAGQMPLFQMPETTLAALASELKGKLGAAAVRVIGNPGQKVRRVALVAGAAPSQWQMSALNRPDVDVVVIGESREWETFEYARDAAKAGLNKGLIVLGHVVSEEAGMEYCARWLRGFVTEVPVEFIPAGEPYWTPK